MPQPIPIDDIGVLEIPEKIHGERVLCRDLAAFLGVGVITIHRLARDRDCLHFFRWGRPSSGAGYVTPFMAARIIVAIRAKQEADREKRRRVRPRSST